MPAIWIARPPTLRPSAATRCLALPDDLDYGAIGALSNEVRLKLQAAQPATLGAAARIPGVTPAAMTALLAHVKRAEKGTAA